MIRVTSPSVRARCPSRISMVVGIALLIITAWPEGSAWRDDNGELFTGAAAMMRSIVSLIFLLFLVPGVVYGIASGSMKSSKDMIDGMTHSMHQMAYYLVIMFFISQFVYCIACRHPLTRRYILMGKGIEQ